MQRITVVWLLAVLFCGASAVASDSRQYCNDMYPSDSYSAEDRKFYIEECLAAYGEDDQPTRDVASDDGGDYYDGTIEDYVDSLPEDESPRAE